MCKLGVVVAIYNTDQFLKQCIESIIQQTYKDIQIVLVDDGSTDNSGEICDYYAMEYENVRVIHQKNCGKLIARYNGAKATSNCDYITFVDSDDWLDTNIYQRLSPYMSQDIDVIEYGSFSYSEDETSRYSFMHPIKLYSREDIEAEILPKLFFDRAKDRLGVSPALWNKLIKRNFALPFLKLAAENLEIGYGDDIAIIFPLMYRMNSYVVVNEYGYFYRHQRNYVPQYLSDPFFYKKLLDLYDFLIENIEITEDYKQQVDLLFAYAVNFRISMCYGKMTYSNCLFPFHKVPVGKKIILYGAGKMGNVFYNQLSSICYCEKLIWVDKNKQGERLTSLKDALKEEFDYLVIAIKNKKTAQSVMDELINSYHISKEKVVWGFDE